MAAAESGAVEAASAAAATVGAKLAPAAIGALIMIAVGPKTISRREVFLRAAVALGVSHLFGDLAVAYVASFGFEWFSAAKHDKSVYGLLGCVGWGLMGGLHVIAQRFRRDPLKTVRQVRDEIER